MRVEVVSTGGMLRVYCPYSQQFVDFAHMRNAKWSDQHKCWIFDARDEFAVRATLIDIYGTDDYASCEKVDVRVNLDYINVGRTLFLLGRELAYRRSRDSFVELGEGVSIIAGGFPSSGGSTKRPELAPRPGTILEVRDVPRALAERTMLEYDGIEIMGGIDREALQAERERLLKRLAEIDQLLAMPEAVQQDEIIPDLRDTTDEPPESSG